MLPRRTFIVRFQQVDGLAVLENVETGERLRVASVECVGHQLARWLDAGEAQPVPEQQEEVPDDR